MTDIRVTQAGRQAPTQEDADVRVTQAGRQAVTQEGADVRVTQAGRQAAGQFAENDLRVTMLGRVVLITEPSPTAPNLIVPYDDQIVSETLYVTYDESTDPLEGTIWYTARLKLTTDTAWTAIFTDALYNSVYDYDVSGLTDGDYDFEIWAETVGYSSQVVAVEFTIHNGRPTAPTITAPYDGQEWDKSSHDLTWEPSVDPDDDPLTYNAQYRAVGAGSWTPLFTDDTSPYAWDLSGFAEDDYEVEVWSNDGEGDSLHDHAYFTVQDADQPYRPRISVTALTQNSVTVTLDTYEHPTPRDWQATKYEMIPLGGIWTNPIESYTTTDPAEQYTYTFNNLEAGFFFMVRAAFQDNNNSWSEYSLIIGGMTSAEDQRLERRWADSKFGGYLGWAEGTSRAGLNGAQLPSAIVDPEADGMGSFIMTGSVQGYGCYCGWPGRDSEMMTGGLGVFQGYAETGDQKGVGLGLSFGNTDGISGGHYARLMLRATFEDCVYYTSRVVYGPEEIAYIGSRVEVPIYGQPIGDPSWYVTLGMMHWYSLLLWVQRNVATNTTRVRGKITLSPLFYSVLEGSMDFALTSKPEDEWDIDETFDCLTDCGKPGWWHEQLAQGQISSGFVFFGLNYQALRDEGIEDLYNYAPADPYAPPADGPCTPITEDALSTPVFFPAPPNGDVEEEWVHPSDLIRARDDTEQRISLREIPYERISFNVTLPTSREVGHLHALIWEEQPSRWGVPLWMDAARLDVDLTSGASSIPASSVDTDGRRFDEATYVAIWKDQFTWDFLPCTYNADGSISLTGSTSRTYYAYGTYVIPCRIGRMGPTAEFPRSSPEIGDLEVTFVLEAVDG